MPSFIKLADRTILSNIVRQLRKGTGKKVDPKFPTTHGGFYNKHIEGPAIFLDIAGKQTLSYVFDDEQTRDAEFDRIEAILVPKPQVLFNALLLSPVLIQAMHIEWIGHMDSTLKLRIKVADTNTYVVHVTPDEEEDWKRAQDLISQLGLTVPKTMKEKLAELRSKSYDENGKRKPGHTDYGVL